MGDQISFHNKTQQNSAYIRQKKLLVFYSSAHKFLLAGGTVLVAGAVVLAFLHVGWISLFALIAGIFLCWFLPVKGSRQLFAQGGEIRTDFNEKGFQVAENFYRYDRIRLIRLLGGWLILELPRKSIVLDVQGFEGSACEEFIAYLTENYPEVPVKRQKSASCLFQIIQLLGVALLGITLTVFGLCHKVDTAPPFNTPPETIVSTVGRQSEEPVLADDTIEMPSDFSDDSRLLADPLKTVDFDYFSMELPEGLYLRETQEDTNGTVSIRYFNRAELVLLVVQYVPKEIAAETSVEEVAAVCSNNFDRLTDISVSAAGNYCFEITNIDTGTGNASGYFFCLDADLYYAVITISCPDTIYEDYLSHFKKWEQSIVINDPPTGEFLSLFS